MKPIGEILSGDGEATPQPEKTQDITTETTAAPEPATQETEADEPQVTEHAGQRMVPVQALDAQRAKVKRYTEQVADFERQLKERDERHDKRFNELIATLRTQPAQPQEPAKEPDFFENPDEYLRHKIAPLHEQLQRQSEGFSRTLAVREHGAETVKGAYAEMEKRIASGDPAATANYQTIMRSDDPWDNLVQWHKRESAIAEIGQDPNAYREKLKAEVLAELQQQNGQPQGGSPASVMPSNFAGARNVGTRSGPAWGGPKPLNDILSRGPIFK